MRRRTWVWTAAASAASSSSAAMKRAPRSGSGSTTPSMTTTWKWGCGLSEAPNRWMNATAPVRAGEEELFKARAKEQGRVKLIDLITARLDARNDCFVAELPSLRLKDVRIEDAMVHSHERMPTSSASATCWVPCRRQRPSGRACAARSRTSTPAPGNWWGTAIPGLTSSRSGYAPTTPVNRVPPRGLAPSWPSVPPSWRKASRVASW